MRSVTCALAQHSTHSWGSFQVRAGAHNRRERIRGPPTAHTALRLWVCLPTAALPPMVRTAAMPLL